MSFKRFGSLVLAERVTIENWRKQVVASSVRQDPGSINPSALDVDDANFIYVRARAVSAGEYHGPNGNGDYFPEAELQQNYKTFIRRGNYLNHESEDVDKAVGIILDAKYWDDPGTKYVECLLAVDKSQPIADKIAKGITTDVSMGAIVERCECSFCGTTATSEDEYCTHLKSSIGREINGRKIYAINRGVNFYELSWVTTGADKDAKILERVASKQETNFQRLEKIAEKFQQMKTADEVAKPSSTEKTKPKDDGLDSAVEKVITKEVEREVEKDLVLKVRDALKKLQTKKVMDRELSDEEILQAVRQQLGKKLSQPQLPVASALHQVVSQTLESVDNQDNAVDLGEGYSVIPSGKVAGISVVQLLDRGRSTGLFAPNHVTAALGDTSIRDYYRQRFSLASTETPKPELESAQLSKEDTEVKSSLAIQYIPGTSLDKSFFVARKGNLEIKQSADKLLSDQLKKAILAKEAAGKVEYGVDDYDITKGKTDTKMEIGKEKAQPGELTKNLGGVEKGVGDYDITKGKTDTKMEIGKEPAQPSQVVSKYASLSGGKLVNVSEAKSTGIVTASIEGGSIVRLAREWGTTVALMKSAQKKEAKITGEPPVMSRELTEPVQQDPKDHENMLARQTPDPVDGTGPEGSRGSEQQKYWSQVNKGNLSDAGPDGWARKVASLQGKVSALDNDNKRLAAENKLLKSSFDNLKKAQEDEKRATLVNAILERMKESGALVANQGEILQLKDEGLEHDDAVTKATANAEDRQKKELASLDISALEKMSDMIQKYALTKTRTAETEHLKPLDIPDVGRDDQSSISLEDKLASSW